jgi:hypothetical protein
MRARSKSASADKTNMTRLVRVAELLVGVTAFVGLQLWLIYRHWRQEEARAVEAMNVCMSVDDQGHWFLRGFGYRGSGATPEDAMRELVIHHNTHEPTWPVRQLTISKRS